MISDVVGRLWMVLDVVGRRSMSLNVAKLILDVVR